MVNRLKLKRLVQGPDKPVQQFVASLKQVARTCKYTVKCTAEGCVQDVDYSNEMVLDQLVGGLNDDEIQKKVLSSSEQDFNLQNVEKIIVAEECSKFTQRESKVKVISAFRTSCANVAIQEEQKSQLQV